MSTVTQRFLSVKETATYLGVDERTVSRLLADGDLTRHEVRRTPRIDLEELHAYLLRNNPAARERLAGKETAS